MTTEAEGELFELARELIDIPSVSGQEATVVTAVRHWLERHGFTVEMQEVEPRRHNVFARRGDPRVVLSTHLDTVPPFIPSDEDDEWIHGRGSCDAKGIAAAMMIAARVAEAPSGVLFVVAEETDSVGAKKANEWLEERGIRWLVNGEPTDSSYVSATKGSLTIVARFRGKAAHSAYPERGESAVLHLTAAVQELALQNWGSDAEMGDTTLNIGVVRGGDKPNIVPAWAEAELMFRTTVAREEILGRVERILAKHGGRIIRTYGNEPTRMHVPAGQSSKIAAFNTDVPHLRSLGTPILYGPGSILDAHSDHERVAKVDLVDASVRYQHLIETLE